VKAARAIHLPSYLEPRKLPVFTAVFASYWFVLRNIGPLCRTVLLPLAVMLPLVALATWLVSPWLPAPDAGKSTLTNEIANWVLTLVQTPFLASMAVTWHRFLLLQEAPKMRPRLTDPVWRYALIYLSLQVMVYIPTLLASFDSRPSLMGFYGFAIFFFVLPRISLELPAAALDANLPFTEAWWATRSNTLRLAFASLLCSLPPLLLVGFVLLRVDRSTPEGKIAFQVIGAGLSALIAIIAVTFLSLTYRFFIRRQELDAS